MSTAPTWRVWLGLTQTTAGVWDVSLWDAFNWADDLGYVWTEVTGDVLDSANLTITSGQTGWNGPYLRTNAGRATFTLDNQYGKFDPLNLTGPFAVGGFTLLLPGIPVRITADFGGDLTVMHVGRADDWPVSYNGIWSSKITITSIDATEELTAANPYASNPAGAGDTVQQRIGRILDNIGWGASRRDLGTVVGDVTLQATTMAQAAWTDMLLSADSQSSHIWVDRRGNVVLRNRLEFPAAPQVRFGMTPGLIPWDDITPDVAPRSRVLNQISFARVGGFAQVAQDDTSIAKNGPRSYNRTDLLCQSDDLVQEQLLWILSQWATLVAYRIESITVSLVTEGSESASHWPAVLGVELGNRIGLVQVTPDGRTITLDGIVSGINWIVQPATGVYQATFRLFPPPNILPASVWDTAVWDAFTWAQS